MYYLRSSFSDFLIKFTLRVLFYMDWIVYTFHWHVYIFILIRYIFFVRYFLQGFFISFEAAKSNEAQIFIIFIYTKLYYFIIILIKFFITILYFTLFFFICCYELFITFMMVLCQILIALSINNIFFWLKFLSTYIIPNTNRIRSLTF